MTKLEVVNAQAADVVLDSIDSAIENAVDEMDEFPITNLWKTWEHPNQALVQMKDGREFVIEVRYEVTR